MATEYLNIAELTQAFPVATRADASIALSQFPATRLLGQSFSVRIGTETVTLPNRLWNDPKAIQSKGLTDKQTEFVDCLMTRHSDGFVRQYYLERIVHSANAWIPPFVIKLAGEYVIEILQAIQQNLPRLDKSVYASFLRENPSFFVTTEQHVASYWNCYYRDQRRQDYVGFQLMEFFKALMWNCD